jgi:hypothetical protein
MCILLHTCAAQVWDAALDCARVQKREARMAKEELSGRIKEREGELHDLRYLDLCFIISWRASWTLTIGCNVTALVPYVQTNITYTSKGHTYILHIHKIHAKIAYG